MRWALLASLAFAALTGCGGAASRLTAGAYTRQANAECAATFHRLRTLPPSATNGFRYKLFRRLLARLQALRPPQGEQATADRWLKTFLASYFAAVRAEGADDASVRRFRRLHARSIRLARSLGLRACVA